MNRKREFAEFYLKRAEDMNQSTINKWETETPPGIPEKVAMINFFSGFEKKAYGKASVSSPGSDSFLNWNEGGGVEPRNEQDVQMAQGVGLKTLPADAPGANCATCKYFRVTDDKKGLGLCQNPEVRQDVTARMLCDLWENPGTEMAVEEPPEEEGMEGEIPPEEEAMGDIPGEGESDDMAMQQGDTVAEKPPVAGEQPPEVGDDTPTTSEPASMTGEVSKQMPELKEKAEKKPKKEPKEKKDDDGKKDKQTININVGSEKKASLTDLVMGWV